MEGGAAATGSTDMDVDAAGAEGPKGTKAVPYGGHICRNQYQIGFRIRRNPALWGQKHGRLRIPNLFSPCFRQIRRADWGFYGFAPISLAPAFCYLLLIVFVFK